MLPASPTAPAGEPVGAVCLVSPARFGFNDETAATNRFQRRATVADAAESARAECAALASALRQAGIRVCVVPDEPSPPRPDAVFPNNWVSFHADGTLVLYPMQAPNRRLERREAVLEAVVRELGFTERRRLDLSPREREGRFLEGTGSLVLDRTARVAYACLSPRTDAALAREWAAALGYELECFHARSPDGTPVYHTNVLLWIGREIAGIGLDWIDVADRERVLERLRAGGRRILALDGAAIVDFAGNALELRPAGAARGVVAMSTTAAGALGASGLAQVREAGCDPLVVDIPVIESLGGGSVRCMIAEVPLAQGQP